MSKKSSPGVSRKNRISDEGLERLEKQLSSGVKISRPVLAQWVRRYGEAARLILRRYDMDSDEFDALG